MLLTARSWKDSPSTMLTLPGVRACSDSTESRWPSTSMVFSWVIPASWPDAGQGNSRTAMMAMARHDARGVATVKVDMDDSWKNDSAKEWMDARVSGDCGRTARTQAARMRLRARDGGGRCAKRRLRGRRRHGEGADDGRDRGCQQRAVVAVGAGVRVGSGCGRGRLVRRCRQQHCAQALHRAEFC